MALRDENQNITTSRVGENQFKATRIWNEILEAFYMGIEMKHHKRKLKIYYDCFVASEAVSWLKNHLKDCDHLSGTKVTRFQALNLLRKYHEAEIIERVVIEKNHKQVQDDNSLYHFTVEAKENLPFLKNQAARAAAETVELSINKKIEVYQNIIWKHLVAKYADIPKYIKQETIDGQSLYNNINKVNSNGVVQLTDRTQDLPDWVLSAMKCLANWPKASGSGNCLPKYPGFEIDVFTIIKDYFNNFEEPLVPHSFYNIIMLIFNKYTQAIEVRQPKPDQPKPLQNLLNLPTNCVYETAFSGCEPVTKIVPIDEFSGVFPDFIEYFQNTQSFTMSKTNTSLLSPPFNNSTNTANNTFRMAATLDRRHMRAKTPTPRRLIDHTEHGFSLESPPESSEYMLTKNLDTRRFHSLGRNFKQRKVNPPAPPPVESNKNDLYECLHLILLIFPSRNRRLLQLLIRMIHKVINNDQLDKGDILTKANIIDTFTRTIIRPDAEIDYDERQAKKYVTFLVDECMNIFQAKEAFTVEVDEAIKKLQEIESHTAYCAHVKSEEFEMQRDVFSEQALTELLESILKSDSMSERDKLKWIKQFKMYHPEVYDVYFTNNSAAPLNITGGGGGASTSSNENAEKRWARSLSILPDRKLMKRFISLKF